MNDPQVEIAKEWLSERGTGSEDGRICAYMLKDYIEELEAAIDTWKKEEELWREREAELLVTSKRVQQLFMNDQFVQLYDKDGILIWEGDRLYRLVRFLKEQNHE